MPYSYCPNSDCPDFGGEFLPGVTHCSRCNATLVADRPVLPVGPGRHLRPRDGFLAAAVPPGLKLLGAVFGLEFAQSAPWGMVVFFSAFLFLLFLIGDWLPDIGGG